ncbi:MAG: hypothetical protein FWE19_05405 [Oscillospiraceae bacterium]|nr:hypothetical protein [Oscillospiraceae bacterium]
MKYAYKKAVGLFTTLFVLGVVIMAVANFMRHLPIHGTLITAGTIVLASALIIYMAFWRCPVCRELLQRQITVPHSCKSCGARLIDNEDEGSN